MAKIQDNWPAADAKNGVEEFSVADLLGAIWETRRWVGIATLLTCLALIGLAALRYVAIPSYNVYRHAIQFTFAGAGSFTYPNEAQFSLYDIKSPAILQTVFEENNLADYDISLDEFTEFVSVEPFAPTYDMVVENFRVRLENRQLTVAERRQVALEMRQAINALTSRNAVISFNIQGRQSIPAELGARLVNDIPEAWSNMFINQLGVVATPIAVSDQNIADEELAGTLDNQLLLDYLGESFSRTRKHLEALSELAFAQGSVDNVTGKSVLDLIRELEDLETFRLQGSFTPLIQLGITQNPDFIKITYNNRLRELQRDVLGVEAEMAAVQQTIDIFQVTTNTGDAQLPEISPNATSISEFGNNFIDRIIELTDSSLGFEYRRELSEKFLELNLSKIQFEQAINRTRERINATNNTQQGENNRGAGQENAQNMIKAESKSIINSLNEIWQTANRVFSQISTDRLSYNGRLYRSIPLEPAHISSHPVFSQRSILLFVAANLAAFLFAMFAHLILQMRRRTKPQ